MRFEVVQTRRARADVATIARWLNQRLGPGPDAWYRQWVLATKRLGQSADQFGTAPESDSCPEKILQLQFKTRRGRFFRVLFVIRGDTVYILHVMGAGQDLLSPEEIVLPEGPRD